MLSSSKKIFSNHIQITGSNRSIGKLAHNSHVQCTNYFVEEDVKTDTKYFELGAKLEFGRIRIAYVGLAN